MSAIVIRGICSDDLDHGSFDARRVAGFTGEVGQTHIEQIADLVVGLAGLGPRADATLATIRSAASAIARRVSRSVALTEKKPVELDIDVDSFTGAGASAADGDRAVSALTEGLEYGGYRFRMTGATTFYSAALPIVEPSPVAVPGWTRGRATGAAVNRARDLVNLPPNALTPTTFASQARALLEPLGVRVVIRGAAELGEGGYGGIVAIGQGSQHPPALLELALGNGQPEFAFVGKGVTYDSGGLSLKPADGLIGMKSDMAGAAAVVSVFSLLPAIAPGRSFVGVIPLVENMPGPAATRPGDVAVLRNGTTLEILNTDFEGRVILADALARAAELAPRAIIDLASLTYASQHALGDEYAALVATDEELADRLLQAGMRAGDLLWRMPLQPGLDAQIRSDLADYKNFPGSPTARISSAALLLSQFVGDVPWAHIDMAGPCFRPAAGVLGAAGGTGYGVRLLAELVRHG